MAALGQQTAKCRKGEAVAVMVEIEQDHGIRCQRHQRIADRQDIVPTPPDIMQQQARPVASQTAVPQRDPDRGLRRRSARNQTEQKRRNNQAEAKAFPSESAKRRRLLRIIRATRAIATPRITRLAGR